MFTGRTYGRTEFLPDMSAQAAALIELRDARLLRRNPKGAAVIRAERIIVANRPRSR